MDLMLAYTTIAATIGVVWTALQQERINKICEKCPFFPPNKQNIEIELKRKKNNNFEVIP